MATELLDALKDATLDIESYGIDVKRLLDEKGPINAGDEAMFVATASFRVRRDGEATLPRYLGRGDKIFEIRSDGEWVSPLEELDVIEGGTSETGTPARDELEEFIHQTWNFQFFVNGREWTQHHPGDPPWVIRVDTSLLADDYLRVEVDIERREVVTEPEDEDDPFVDVTGLIKGGVWVHESTLKQMLTGSELRLTTAGIVDGEQSVVQLRVVPQPKQIANWKTRNKATTSKGG